MDVVFIGAGNLATHLAKELAKYSFNILQVYSRTIEAAQELANKINSTATNNIKDIKPNADIYIFSVKDTVLSELIRQIEVNKNSLWLHTAGSMPISVFDKYTNNYGVLYPFQTFSKARDLDLKKVPLFIEANNTNSLQLLESISNKITNHVYQLSSQKRQYLHLTGVFACNFVNHMYTLSNEILKKENIPFDVLLPLIDETASKVHELNPKDAQTGPAVRYDENIINKHLSLIDDPKTKEIYQIISENIHRINSTK
jgi:predicted short-subunit dehydrogenase-like oxidoreductase (DUF2520 family)